MTCYNKLSLEPVAFFNMQMITSMNQQRLGRIKKIKQLRIYERKVEPIAQKRLKKAKNMS